LFLEIALGIGNEEGNIGAGIDDAYAHALGISAAAGSQPTNGNSQTCQDPWHKAHQGAHLYLSAGPTYQGVIQFSPSSLHVPFLLQRPAPRERFFRDCPRASSWRNTESPMTDTATATPAVSANDTIRTKGILHFTIGVRDHISAAKFYSEVLG